MSRREARRRRERQRHVQLNLEFRTWGGRRRGAGRKRKAPRPRVPHRRRPDVDGRTPVHITYRLRADVPRLRRRDLFREIRAALARCAERDGFRLCHFTIQGNHLHLVVEPRDRVVLSRRMQGLASLIARRINRALGRRGKVFEDRYHARYLETPAQVRAALCYVLNNWRRHGEHRARPRWRVDPYSSAELFDGWADHTPRPPPELVRPPPVAPARTWLLTVGWRRHGLIRVREVPGQR